MWERARDYDIRARTDVHAILGPPVIGTVLLSAIAPAFALADSSGALAQSAEDECNEDDSAPILPDANAEAYFNARSPDGDADAYAQADVHAYLR